MEIFIVFAKQCGTTQLSRTITRSHRTEFARYNTRAPNKDHGAPARSNSNPSSIRSSVLYDRGSSVAFGCLEERHHKLLCKFVSCLFVIPMDCMNPLNVFMKSKHFKIEELAAVRELVREGD